MIDLFIGSTVRSGGSLLARLFDHHPDVGSYPFELHLPIDPALHPSLARRGEKNHVQNYPDLTGRDVDGIAAAMLLHDDPTQCLVGRHFVDGKLNAKSRGLDIETSFDHARFLQRAKSGFENVDGVGRAYQAMHRAFFESWDQGAHGGSLQYVAYHRANGLLADIPLFTREFDGWFIQPVRSIDGCVASEKRKVISQLASGQVGRGFSIPDRMLRRFHGRFVENTICNWLVTFTRSVILKEELGDRYLVVRFEDLVSRPEETMRAICERIGMAFHPRLLEPTNAGHRWGGNSMFGQKEGIDADAADDRIKPHPTEKAILERHAGEIRRWLKAASGPLLDYQDLDRDALFDYIHQRRYFGDREKTALYFASLYERWRYRPAMRQLFSQKAKPYYL